MKKLIALLLVLAMGWSLCACVTNDSGDPDSSENAASDAATSNNATITTDESGHTAITIALSSDPKTLCPWGSDGGGRNYTRAIAFEQLTSTDNETGE